jgi:hypothetical protein
MHHFSPSIDEVLLALSGRLAAGQPEQAATGLLLGRPSAGSNI